MFFYFRQSDETRKRVICYSRSKQDLPQFGEFEYTPTPEEQNLIDKNCDLFLDNDIFVIEKTDQIKKEEMGEALQRKLELGQNITTKELGQIMALFIQ